MSLPSQSSEQRSGRSESAQSGLSCLTGTRDWALWCLYVVRRLLSTFLPKLRKR